MESRFQDQVPEYRNRCRIDLFPVSSLYEVEKSEPSSAGRHCLRERGLL